MNFQEKWPTSISYASNILKIFHFVNQNRLWYMLQAGLDNEKSFFDTLKAWNAQFGWVFDGLMSTFDNILPHNFQKMHLFRIWGCQKIEQVYWYTVMTLPAPETFNFDEFFAIYWKKWKFACDLGLGGYARGAAAAPPPPRLASPPAGYDIDWTSYPKKTKNTDFPYIC